MKTKIFGSGTGLPVGEIVPGAARLCIRRGYGAPAEHIPRILGAYADAGGRFIDVADQYQLGEPEDQVGRALSHLNTKTSSRARSSLARRADPGLSA